MDDRCPRKLDNYPDSWCPLAVQRLKALRHADRDLTEEEESQLSGCEWAVNYQLANYCFFKLIDEHMPNTKNLSDMEIAHYCNVSTEVIKKTEKRAIDKIKKSESFKEAMKIHEGDAILDNDPGDWDMLDN